MEGTHGEIVNVTDTEETGKTTILNPLLRTVDLVPVK